jgi:hypothetical protein
MIGKDCWDDHVLNYKPTWDILDSTKLACFMRCPRLYFYEYVLGWRPEEPNNHLEFGKAWHKALEFLIVSGYSFDNAIRAIEIFYKEYRKYFPPETDALLWPKTPANVEIVLPAYVNKWKHDVRDYEVMFTEVGGAAYITEDIKMHVKMDTILRRRSDNKIISLEHKTSQSIWNWAMQWPLSLQIGTYTHMLYSCFPPEEVGGVTVNGAIFRKVKQAWEAIHQNKHSPYDLPYEFHRVDCAKTLGQMNIWAWNTMTWVDQLIHNFKELLKCTEDESVLCSFPMRTTSCTDFFGCVFHDYCMAWTNPLRVAHEPPLGFIEKHWDPSRIDTRYEIVDGEVKEVENA